MSDLLILGIVLGAYYLIQRYILPFFGVPT
ncbi:MAG: hypothetical protein ACI8PG_005543 [Planctomycetota bacterium]|jgi:hypothetical protein